MKKEPLTLSNILDDFKDVLSEQWEITAEWKLGRGYIYLLLAITSGFLFKNIWIVLLFLGLTGYRVFVAARERRAHKEKRDALMGAVERADICISVERFDYTAVHTLYEPHSRYSGGRHRGHLTKNVRFFYFSAGKSWRPPLGTHYKWSTDYRFSTAVLDSLSVRGDEFYYVSLKGYHEIAYIYPCKYFELEEELEKKQ